MSEEEKRKVAEVLLRSWAIEAAVDGTGIAELIDVPEEDEQRIMDEITHYIRTATVVVVWNEKPKSQVA